ncbi:unnamed protein product [Peniophora sp. CBMAI 1063]|nr:unnamed protein product [Peniophora sp. CBMAI 1063]
MSSACPASRLPDELLSLVLDAIARDVRVSQDRAILAIRISHVCRFWRTVAFGPGGRMLWTHIPIWSGVDCARAFIERSDPLPFTLNIDLGDTAWPPKVPALAEAAQSMHRAGTIDLAELYDRDEPPSPEEAERDEQVYAILRLHPAPLLTRFNVVFAHILPPMDETPLLAPDMFGGDVPQALRILVISNRQIMPDSTFLRGSLTALVLRSCRIWDGIDEVLLTLSHLPGLEVLVLESETSTFCPDATESFALLDNKRYIALPRLKVLKIEDDDFAAPFLLLAYLRAPSTARIHLTPGSSDFDWLIPADEGPELETRVAHDITLLRLGLTTHFQAGSTELVAPFRTIAIAEEKNNWKFTIHAVRDSGVIGNSIPDEFTLTYYAGAQTAAGRRRFAAVANAILSLPAMSQADFLIVSLNCLYGSGRSSDWLALRDFLPQLRTIEVSRGAIHGVLSALHDSEFFPGLERLTFAGMHLEDNEQDAARAALYLVALRNILCPRGRPPPRHLQTISFDDCFGAKKLARTLKRLSPDTMISLHCSPTVEDASEREAAWDDAEGDIDEMVDYLEYD